MRVYTFCIRAEFLFIIHCSSNIWWTETPIRTERIVEGFAWATYTFWKWNTAPESVAELGRSAPHEMNTSLLVLEQILQQSVTYPDAKGGSADQVLWTYAQISELNRV